MRVIWAGINYNYAGCADDKAAVADVSAVRPGRRFPLADKSINIRGDLLRYQPARMRGREQAETKKQQGIDYQADYFSLSR